MTDGRSYQPGDALLVGPGTSFLLCEYGDLVGPYRATAHEFTRPAPDPVVVDHTDTGPGVGTDPWADPTPTRTLVIGRVAPGVRRIEVTAGPYTAGSPLYNGTFLARVEWTERPPPTDLPIVVRAYDEDDRLIGTARP